MLLENTILVGLSVASLLFILKKWGAIDLYQVYRLPWMPDADCYFCLSFWYSLIGCVWLGKAGLYGLLAFPAAALSAFILTLIIAHADADNQ